MGQGGRPGKGSGRAGQDGLAVNTSQAQEIEHLYNWLVDYNKRPIFPPRHQRPSWGRFALKKQSGHMTNECGSHEKVNFNHISAANFNCSHIFQSSGAFFRLDRQLPRLQKAISLRRFAYGCVNQGVLNE